MSVVGRGGVVPIEVARKLHAERDQALAYLERAQRESAALRRALQQREADMEDSTALRAELDAARARFEALEADHAAATLKLGELHASEPDGARVQELLGDLANLRRRTAIDVAAAVRSERLRLLGRLAEVRATVFWALEASPDPNSTWYTGLVGIREQIDQQLRAEHASVFGTAGDVFDPRLHEAVGNAPGGPPGRIARVESPGVALDDGTVVTPARVWVSA